MRITSKGQMTIPKEARDELGLTAGTEADVEKNDRGEYVLVNLDARRNESAGQRLVRQLVEFGDRMRREGKIDPHYINMTTDQIMEELREYSEDENDPGFKRSV
jgi:AbrB family looped-hinge helix DNA binding protein